MNLTPHNPTLETVWHGATWREGPQPVLVVEPYVDPNQTVGERVMALMADGQRRRECDIRLALRKGYTTVHATVRALVDAGRLTRTSTCRDIWYQAVGEGEAK